MWSFDKLKANIEAISSFQQDLVDVHSKTLTEAAVLVPIVIKNGVPFVLLTVRSMNLSSYPGQVSFPGGKRDSMDENIVATALRETYEEIGMASDNLKIIGNLLPYVTQTNYVVTPVVAEVLNYKTFSPSINPFEVCEILTVPLETFILKKYHKSRLFTYGKHEGKQSQRKLDYFEFGESSDNVHIIWGLTALIATRVASLLFERSPEFEYQEWLSGSERGIDKNKVYDKLLRSKL